MDKKFMAMSVFFVLMGIGMFVVTNIIEQTKSTKEAVSTFKIEFDKVIVDGIDKTDDVSDSGRGFVFYPTKVANLISTVDYKITNSSPEYKTKVSINCKMDDKESYEISLPESFYVDPMGEKEGQITIKALRNIVTDNKVRCTLNVRSVERVKQAR